MLLCIYKVKVIEYLNSIWYSPKKRRIEFEVLGIFGTLGFDETHLSKKSKVYKIRSNEIFQKKLLCEYISHRKDL